MHQSWGPQVRKAKCTHRRARVCGVPKGYFTLSKASWKTATPSVCLQLISYLMERLGWGKAGSIDRKSIRNED